MILNKIEVNPYAVDLWVLVTGNPHKDVPQTNVSNPGINISWSDGMAAWTNDHFYNGYVIAVVFDAKCFDIATAAHQAIHIKNMIYTHYCIKHDLNNDEPEAYLTGWLVGKIEETYKQFKKK